MYLEAARMHVFRDIERAGSDVVDDLQEMRLESYYYYYYPKHIMCHKTTHTAKCGGCFECDANLIVGSRGSLCTPYRISHSTPVTSASSAPGEDPAA